MKPTTKSTRTPEQRAEEEAVRRQHAANPIGQRPAGAINRQRFAEILSLMARFKAIRECQGLTLADVAERMGIDAPALSRLETGKMLNPTLATLHKWAEALGQKLDVDLKENIIFKLTEEQKNLLILMGKPDDGSQIHIVVDGERITQQLIALGLVYHTGKDSTGKDSYDLTDGGEQIYAELSGEDIS